MRFKEKYARYYDLFNKNYDKECDFLEAVFKKYSKTPIKTILDLGCGTGLHTKELVSRNYELTGLDLSEEMIKIAKQRNPDSDFVVGDMSNFNLGKKFDAVICMFSALGYLTENKQLEGFFNSVKKHLNQGGLLIIDCWNGLGVMNELPSSKEKSAEIEGLKIVRKSFPDLDAKNHINNVKFNVKVFESENNQNKLIDEYEEEHKVRFFFAKELEKYIEDEGFELVHICPSFEIDEELSEKHWNMVIVGN